MERTEAPGLDPPQHDWTQAIARKPAPAAPPPGKKNRARFRVRPWVNVALFIVTCFTVATMHLQIGSWEQLIAAVRDDPRQLLTGVPFAVTLMSILLAHEMGHYFTARRNGVQQSLPFFIPAPTLLGTMGAVIFLRSPPPDRRVLLNIAVMGPYAGLILAIPAIAWGLAHSSVDSGMHAPGTLELGSSLLFSGLQQLFGPSGNLMLHPIAQAGWYGLFVTSLNLIPAGQLDGGHVTYALFARYHRRISLVSSLLLLCGGASLWLMPGFDAARVTGVVWMTWAGMLLLFGTGHPRVTDDLTPLSRSQRANGWFALAVFALTFIPVPFRLSQPPETAIAVEQHEMPVLEPSRLATRRHEDQNRAP